MKHRPDEDERMTTPTGNPFVDIDPDDVYPAYSDSLTNWREVWPDGMDAAGDRLAAELTRTRAMAVALEQENHALRGLVERAQTMFTLLIHKTVLIDRSGRFSDWLADADRVLHGYEDSE